MLVRIVEGLQGSAFWLSSKFTVNAFNNVSVNTSREYRDLIEFRLYQQLQSENMTPSSKLVGKLVELAKLEAKYNGKQKLLSKRVAEHVGNFYYDMSNDDWGVIKITLDKWGYCHTNKALFERCQIQTPQVMPVQNGDINKLDKYLNNVPAHQRILVKVHIVTCLVPNISHAPLIIQSEKGSGKTTLTQMLKTIIDPGSKYPLQLNPKELALNLHSNYLANFDNLSHISSGISDMFCRAVTGATDNKRKLHTDTELITRLSSSVMDPVSAILSLSDTDRNDSRVEEAIEQIMEEYVW